MNILLSPQPPLFHPHQHDSSRRSPPRSLSSYTMTSKKRKADDGSDMSVSPNASPAISNRQLSRPSKKVRAGADPVAARPLTLPRLLETLDTTQLRRVLQNICDRHPALGQEIETSAPRPTVESTMVVLDEYLDRLRAAVPFGNSSSDYTYFRVKQPLTALTDAISDFTPQFLPPLEQQANVSLQYLTAATRMIHELPTFDSQQYRYHKDNAYDDISKAWALVIMEASKRGGGFLLHSNHWDQILSKHNQQSGGKLGQAMSAMANEVGWMGNQTGNAAGSQLGNGGPSDTGSVLDQIVSGAYSSPLPVGPW